MSSDTENAQEKQKKSPWVQERKAICVWASLSEIKSIDRLCKKHKLSRGKMLLLAMKHFAEL